MIENKDSKMSATFHLLPMDNLKVKIYSKLFKDKFKEYKYYYETEADIHNQVRHFPQITHYSYIINGVIKGFQKDDSWKLIYSIPNDDSKWALLFTSRMTKRNSTLNKLIKKNNPKLARFSSISSEFKDDIYNSDLTYTELAEFLLFFKKFSLLNKDLDLMPYLAVLDKILLVKFPLLHTIIHINLIRNKIRMDIEDNGDKLVIHHNVRYDSVIIYEKMLTEKIDKDKSLIVKIASLMNISSINAHIEEDSDTPGKLEGAKIYETPLHQLMNLGGKRVILSQIKWFAANQNLPKYEEHWNRLGRDLSCDYDKSQPRDYRSDIKNQRNSFSK